MDEGSDPRVTAMACLWWLFLSIDGAKTAYGSERLGLGYAIGVGILGSISGVILVPLLHFLIDEVAQGSGGRAVAWGIILSIPAVFYGWALASIRLGVILGGVAFICSLFAALVVARG